MNLDFWKNKKILLTGHTGFKGSWLSLWLQKLGTDLIGYSNSVPTIPSLFELTNLKDGMTSLIGDVRDLHQLNDAIKEFRPEIVIHMAAQSLVRKSYQNPLETYSTNIMGVANILEAVRTANNIRVCMIVTSDKCYDNKGLERGYNEDDSMGGYDPYSSSKGCAELVTNSFRNSFFNTSKFNEYKTTIASVRAGNVIGGGDWASDRLIPDIMNGVFQNKTVRIRNPDSMRPWQFVLEPLYGYLMLIEKLWDDGPLYSGAWNFGPDYNDVKPVLWIVDTISQLLGKNISWELDDQNSLHEAKSLLLDCTKAKTKLGWKPKTDLRLALQLVIDWYKKLENKVDVREFTEQQIKYYHSL
ncbi:MAG: CDP-glucose 4,6-dehydratase [Nitrosopumilaceae archaeon]